MKKRWIALTLLVGLALAWSHRVSFSLPKDYRLELTILTDKHEEFVFVAELDSREFRRLESNPTSEIQPWLVQARREYATKIGYRVEIYGTENYKMVVIVKSSFVVREVGTGRVVLKKG